LDCPTLASPNGGLIVVVSGASLIHREFIVTLAARHQLPVVYPIASSSQAAG